ncbi:MAG: NAD-dependent epimerase/dehydratase family protein, partial [Gemmatimonadota bacterium]
MSVADEARRVFLTGATGYIGSRLARRFATAGDRLRCLVRPTSDTADLERLGAELVTGDLTDADGLARALDGCDLAYHLAAYFDVGPVDERAMRETNVEGTRAFVEAVERVRPGRAVYVSTTG